MNDQVRPQEQTNTPPAVAEGANARLMGRRQLAKFALGTPVLMTLASRPVLAGQCLSNMLSGNTSPGHDDGHCSGGWSPGGWGMPGGKVGGLSTVEAWKTAGFIYGEYRGNNSTYTTGSGSSKQTHNCKPSQYECYDGGATMANVPLELNQNGVDSSTLLRDLLMDENGTRQLTRHLVCAYLNASLSGKVPGFTYVLTVDQVVGLAKGSQSFPPAYGSLQSFLASTWT